MISNEFHRDARLSFKARGLGGYLLSHAEGWQTSVAAIAKANGVGRDLVRTGLDELIRYGYLRREQARTDDGRVGESEYLIQCTPHDEPAGGDRGRKIRQREIRQREIRPHKKTSSKNNTSGEDQPSGGTADAVAADVEQEAPEMPRPKAPEQPGLFEVVQAEGRQGGKTATQAIVSAFVDSHREQHGADPTRSEIGRVARDSKRLIGNPYTPEQLIVAATAMGKTPFANISMQLKKIGQTSADKGRAPAHPHGAEEWQQGSQVVQNEAAAALDSSPELAAWLAGQAVSA